MATAKHRAIDRIRRSKRLEQKQEELARELETAQRTDEADMTKEIDDDIGDDLLSLVFTACHPVLSTEARVALTLRLLGGAEDGRDRPRLPGARVDRGAANRASEADPGRDARAVRGSEQGRAPGPPVVGAGGHLSGVQRGVLGDRRRRLDAARAGGGRLRLGRILAELVPQEPEVHGLVALMEIQAQPRRASAVRRARAAARSGPRALGSLLIRRGLNALRRAEELGGAAGP